jgi:sulfite reductase alpha subunit-like flavoprotein
MSLVREVVFALLYASIGAILVFIFKRSGKLDDAKKEGANETQVDDVQEDVIEDTQALLTPASSFVDRPESIKIFYGSQTNHSRDFAFSLAKVLEASTVFSISDLDPEDLFIEDALCVFILSTYTDGGPTESTQWFYTWLHDAVNDFRVQKDALSHLRFAVVGLGDTLYGANFCRVAKETFSWLCKLSAKPVYQSVMCDDSNDSGGLFEEWKEMFVKHLSQSDKLPVIDATTLAEIHFESSDEEEGVDVGVPDLEAPRTLHGIPRS